MINLSPELKKLAETAADELVVARKLGNLRRTAEAIIAGAIENVQKSEVRLKNRCGGDQKMFEFVGKNRERTYMVLFTAHGVSEETASKVVELAMK